MTDLKENEELLRAYCEMDALGRPARFKEYVAILKSRIRASDGEDAARWARRAVSLDLDYASQVVLHKILKQGPRAKQPLRVAVLGGPTTTQLVWMMENFIAAHGFEAVFWEGEYGLFRQSLLAPDAGLDAFAPQIVFLATNYRDLPSPPAITASALEVEHRANEEAAQWIHLWQSANARWGAQIIQNLFDSPPWRALGHYAGRAPASRERFVQLVNEQFVRQAPDYVTFHDLQALALEAGARAWYDPRFHYEAKMPCGPACIVPYAHSVAALIAAIRGRSRKVLVLDLDNTLWGGVVGDDGVGGIRIGQGSADGESFLAFQQFAKELAGRGVLLAVCSKNDPLNAREPFEQIAEMALGLDDFSSFVANWNNKPDNLRAMSQELNLGLDSFVFVDDNPAERALVRCELPEVAVPDMPEDPADYIQALARHRYFEPVTLTGEDIKRGEFYVQDRQRRELATTHTDVESFLRSLNMEAVVEPIRDLNIERSTQLINKSNQFNLTTRRYTVAEIKQKTESPDWVTLTITLRDKLGDNGLISVILAQVQGTALAVDSWVMSCRVLQRGVEFLAVNILMDAARQRDCDRLLGVYVPTPKNGMVRDHYSQLGFEKSGEDDAGTTRWARNVSPGVEPFVTHIKVTVDESRRPLPRGGV